MAIIPLGPGSLRDSSSLPEGQSAALLRALRIRAGPALPSYLALHHAGFSVPRMLPPGRWALTPPFHPYQMRLTQSGGPLVLPQACRRGTSRIGGLFSVALSVAAPPGCPCGPLAAQPPGVTRRVALRRGLLRAGDDWCPDFPPAGPVCTEPAGDHPSHPPIMIIAYSGAKGFARQPVGRSKSAPQRRRGRRVKQRKTQNRGERQGEAKTLVSVVSQE